MNITPNDIRNRLERACAQLGSQGEFARKAHVTPAFVSQVVGGRVRASDKILAALGLERVVVVRVRRSGK